MTVGDMTIADAINVANVIAECVVADADGDLRELAAAAMRLVPELGDQARELERSVRVGYPPPGSPRQSPAPFEVIGRLEQTLFWS